jgi:hypothetical protein
MPRQKPHRSKQDYGTPPEFVAAVERRFGTLTWDVAATADNTVVPERFYSLKGIDARTDDWSKRFTRQDLLWINPEFSGLAHVWVPLIAHWARALPWLRIIMLSPLTCGEWYRTYVHQRAGVLGLNPRLHFVGEADPYPKDCMLTLWNLGVPGYDVWRWDERPLRVLRPPGAPAVKRARAAPKRLPARRPDRASLAP